MISSYPFLVTTVKLLENFSLPSGDTNRTIPNSLAISIMLSQEFSLSRYTMISCCLKYRLSSSSTRTRFRKYFTLNLLLMLLYVGVNSYGLRNNLTGIDSPEKAILTILMCIDFNQQRVKSI